jgi:DNA-binding transcriptional MerR regulator
VPTPATTCVACASSSARDLGFSVAEIGELLGLWNDRSRQSADIKRLAQEHIVELKDRMSPLGWSFPN